MINDIALANVGGEVFTEIGQLRKEGFAVRPHSDEALSPGSIGYIPTDKAYLLPAQMAVNNKIKPGCAEPAIVNGFDMDRSNISPSGWPQTKPRLNRSGER